MFYIVTTVDDWIRLLYIHLLILDNCWQYCISYWFTSLYYFRQACKGGHFNFFSGSLYAGDVSNDKTLVNMSMATQQYLQRYNLLAPGYGKRVGAFSPLMENQQEEARQEEEYDTLDIQALKTLPKLAWAPAAKKKQHQIEFIPDLYSKLPIFLSTRSPPSLCIQIDGFYCILGILLVSRPGCSRVLKQSGETGHSSSVSFQPHILGSIIIN